jgi:hypothetical protein
MTLIAGIEVPGDKSVTLLILALLGSEQSTHSANCCFDPWREPPVLIE